MAIYSSFLLFSLLVDTIRPSHIRGREQDNSNAVDDTSQPHASRHVTEFTSPSKTLATDSLPSVDETDGDLTLPALDEETISEPPQTHVPSTPSGMQALMAELDDDLESETSEASQSMSESQCSELEASQLIEGATQVLSLLRVIGKAYTYMCRYVCWLWRYFGLC